MWPLNIQHISCMWPFPRRYNFRPCLHSIFTMFSCSALKDTTLLPSYVDILLDVMLGEKKKFPLTLLPISLLVLGRLSLTLDFRRKTTSLLVKWVQLHQLKKELFHFCKPHPYCLTLLARVEVFVKLDLDCAIISASLLKNINKNSQCYFNASVSRITV